MPLPKRNCEACGITQSIENFSKCNSGKYRRRSCRKCVREQKKLRESGEFPKKPEQEYATGTKEYDNYTSTLQDMLRTRRQLD